MSKSDIPKNVFIKLLEYGEEDGIQGSDFEDVKKRAINDGVLDENSLKRIEKALNELNN